MDSGTIESLIRAGIPGADVEVDDVRGDGRHFAARVVSAGFQGLTRIQQHQMVYKTLQGHIGQDLHAIQLTTSTGEEARNGGQG
jgi:stress-induced morphogen